MNHFSTRSAGIYFIIAMLFLIIPYVSGCGGSEIQGLENAGSTIDGSSVSKSLNSTDKDKSSKQCLYSKVTYTLDNGKIITYQFDPNTLSAVTPSKSATQETRSSGSMRQAYDGTVMGLGTPKAAYVTDKLVAMTNAYTFFLGAGIAEEYIVCPEPSVSPESNIARQGVTVVPSPESGLGPITYTPTAPSFTGAVHIVANYILPDDPPKPWHESWDYVYLVGNPVPVLTQYYSENGNVIGLQFTMGMGSDTENIVLPRTLGDWHFISNNNMAHSDDIINMRELSIKDPVTFVADDNISNKIKIQAEIEELPAGSWTANIARAEDVIVDPDTQNTTTIDLIWDPATKYLSGDWFNTSGILTAALSKGFSLTAREIAYLYTHTITAYENIVKTFALKTAGQEQGKEKLAIENAKATPEEFNPSFQSPNNQSIITASIVAKEEFVAETINWNMVINKGTSVVKTFTDRIGAPGAGPWDVSETWDGKDDSGAFAEVGEYTFKITATATANGKTVQSSASGLVYIVDMKLEITEMVADPPLLYPGEKTTIKIRVVPYPENWHPTVLVSGVLENNSTGAVAAIEFPPISCASPGSIEVPWIWDDSNSSLPPGLYTIKATLTAENAELVKGSTPLELAGSSGSHTLEVVKPNVNKPEDGLQIYPIKVYTLFKDTGIPAIANPTFYPIDDEELIFKGKIIKRPDSWNPTGLRYNIVIEDKDGNTITKTKPGQIIGSQWSGYYSNGSKVPKGSYKFSIKPVCNEPETSYSSIGSSGTILVKGFKLRGVPDDIKQYETNRNYGDYLDDKGNPANWETDEMGAPTLIENRPIIWHSGCLLTALVIAFRAHGLTIGPDNKPCNPGYYNKWLMKNDGYAPKSALIVLKTAVNEYCKQKIRDIGPFGILTHDQLYNYILPDLESKLPVCLRVPLYNVHHTVVAVGECRNDWYTSDPGYFEFSYPKKYDSSTQRGDFQTIIRLAGPGAKEVTNCTPSIAVHASSHNIDSLMVGGSIIELFLTDPLGRRSGYDPTINSLIEEIPNGGYQKFSQGTLISPGVWGPGEIYNKIEIDPAIEPGIYNIKVIGTGSGIYTLDVYGWDTNSDKKLTYFTDIITKDAVHSYALNFNPSNSQVNTFNKLITSSQLKQSIQTAFDLTWIDNKGILNSLTKKMERVESAVTKGHIDTAVANLKAFINEVKAQKGKHIKSNVADILIDDARSYIKQLSNNDNGGSDDEDDHHDGNDDGHGHEGDDNHHDDNGHNDNCHQH